MLDIIKLLLLAGFLYILWTKVGRMYYVYYFYTKQGIPAVALPLPFIGNLNFVQKKKLTAHLSKNTYMQEYWMSNFKQDLPPMILGFNVPKSVILVNDPEIVHELYNTQSKYFDKTDKLRRALFRFVGNSILFSPSNELWAQKRKHLSVAFYKDKLTNMLKMVVQITNQRVKEIKQQKTVDIVQFSGSLVMDCIYQCVFGVTSNELPELQYMENGQPKMLHLGQYLRLAFQNQIMRFHKIYRLSFDFFDQKVIGSYERETIANGERLRNFIRDLIAQRRKDMAKEGFVNKGDFLTILITDELFQGKDEYIIDECVTFMLAATQTTHLLLSNALYEISAKKEINSKLRSE